jgi:murein DD-endopeptidase MepM/ murein hydrolase activator NlpD
LTEPDVIYRLLNTDTEEFVLGSCSNLPFGTESKSWAQFYAESSSLPLEVSTWLPGQDPKQRLYDSPVGTAEERATDQFWPGEWVDANGYLRWYNPGSHWAWHTGADLNLNEPVFDADAHAPVYSIGNGIVYAVRRFSGWDWIICIEYANCLARYAHGEDLQVRQGQEVSRGEFIMRIGDAGGNYPYHLHFDITNLDARMGDYPGDWPREDKARVERDYYDPLKFLRGDYAK